MPVSDDRLKILPLLEEELLGLRPAHDRGANRRVFRLAPEAIADAPFLLYPKRSNTRFIIDAFLPGLGIRPRITVEVDDTEAIKRLVESGFGYSILPGFSLRGQGRFDELFHIAGYQLARCQALTMVRSEYRRLWKATIAP